MQISEEEFENWCFRNGGETYEEEDTAGIVCQFPDTDTPDRVGFYSETGVFEVITQGQFYTSRSFQQHANSWIDENDRLTIDTDQARATIDPHRP